jgi:hypothetical protein
MPQARDEILYTSLSTSLNHEEDLMRNALAAVMFASFVTAAPAADLFAGAWTIVPAKSKNNWDQKPAQKMTRTYTPTAKGAYDVKVEGVNGEGTAVSTTLQAADNTERSTQGSTAPVVKLLGATHVKSRRVNDRTLQATYLKDGKAVGTSTSTVSADGRTLTMRLEGTSVDGKKLSGVNIYEKQ